MGLYKVAGDGPVFDAGPGELLDHKFTADEEAGLLESGVLELEPRPYRVVGPLNVCGTQPGKKFTAAFTVGHEAALIEAGHIVRLPVRKSPPNTKE